MIITTNPIQYTDNNHIILTSDKDINLSTDKNNINFLKYDVATSSYIPLIYSDSTLTNDMEFTFTISGSTIDISVYNLITNTMYMVNLFYVYSADDSDIIDFEHIKFLAVDKLVLPNINNTYTKLVDIQKVLSIDSLLENQLKEHSVSFYPTIYNNDLDKDEYLPTQVSIDNNQLMLNLLLNQYFTEYKTFYNIVNNRNDTQLGTDFKQTYSDEYIKNLHLLFMKNIVKYQSYKGNKFLIDLYMGLYSKYLGHMTISVIEDISQNFMYRISSSIPETMWKEHIKPYVHPLSWNCVYSEIPINILPNSNKLNFESWMRTWRYDAISYLDADNYRKNRNKHFKQLFNIYHNSGNIDTNSVTAHEELGHRNCNFKNLYDYHKFNVNFNWMLPITIDSNENVGNPLYDKSIKLNDLKNIQFFIDRINKKMYIEYKFAGIAHQYIWENYESETNIKTTNNTGLSLTTIDFSDNNKKVILKLDVEGKTKAVHQFDMLAFMPYKTLRYSFAFNQRKNKFINVRASSNRASIENLISVYSFTNCNNFNTYSIVNNVDYDFQDAAFITAIDAPTSITASYTPVTYMSSLYSKISATYDFIGIANKYSWNVKVNGVEIYTFDTDTNNMDVLVADGDRANTTIELTIHHNTGTYTLANIFNCNTLP